MNPLIQKYVEMGFSVFPTKKNKKPVIEWKEYQTRRPTEQELNKWFLNGNNPAVVCGAVSGNLVILDCDDPHISELLQIETLTVRTPSGGLHKYVKSKVIPEKQQAYRGYALDIQGEKAYALLPGSKTNEGEYVIIKDIEIKSFENILEYIDSKLKTVSGQREGDIQTFKKKVGMDIITKWLNFEVVGHNYKQCKCPFHGDTDPSFTVYDSGYYCFGCEEHGDIIDFVMKIENIGFKEAINKISEISGVRAPELKKETHTADSLRSKYLVTDLANAERFVSMYKGDILFVSEWQKWLNWNGKIWETQPNETMYKHAHKTIIEMYKVIPTIVNDNDRQMFAKNVPKCEDSFKLKGMLEQSKPYLLERADKFDTNPMCFVVENGVINLNTLQFEPHDKNRKVTKMSHVVYDPSAKCPKWEEDLNKAFRGNKETIKFFQKAAGYSMTGDTGEQCFFILWGDGANLKSTLTEVICSVIGDYHQEMAVQTIQEREKNNSGPNPELAILAGSRLVRCGENKQEFKLSEGLIKQITGGADGKISCRRLHENDSSFMAEFKIWMYTNHKPQIKGTDYGIWRRVKLIPFTYKIPESEKIPDYHKIIIEQEASGVLNWMLEGVGLWKQEKLGTCPDVEEATNKFRTDNDTILQFITEFCNVAPNVREGAQRLYDTYVKDFCEPMGEYYLTQREFKSKIEEKGYTHEKNKRGHFYIGLELKKDFNNERLDNKEKVTVGDTKNPNFSIENAKRKIGVNTVTYCHPMSADSESAQKPTTAPETPQFQDFGQRAKDWEKMHSKSITNETKIEVSVWIAQSLKKLDVKPSDVLKFLEKSYGLTPEGGS